MESVQERQAKYSTPCFPSHFNLVSNPKPLTHHPGIKNSLVDLGEGTIRLTKHAINKTLDIAEEVAKNGFPQDFGIPRLVIREQRQQQASPASGPHQPQNFQVGGDIASFVLNTEVENQFSVLCGIVAQDGGMEDLLVNYRPAQSQLIEAVLRGLEVQLSQVPLAQSADSEVVAVREALASAVSVSEPLSPGARLLKLTCSLIDYERNPACCGRNEERKQAETRAPGLRWVEAEPWRRASELRVSCESNPDSEAAERCQ